MGIEEVLKMKMKKKKVIYIPPFLFKFLCG